ncbi:MAG TPA: trypsin-like peptidase domain-containing protein [Candidatus Pelethousia gallinarum]|nr:trypsin-like peptidase domain-containing protein [Candidatus Pelethousia gallinarum]
MEATKTSSKRIVAILLLILGLIALVLGVLGLLGGGAMQPYDARNSVVLVAATVADDQGNTSMGWGTGWAIGKPGKPVEYIVTNGHVVEQAYTYPQLYTNVQGQLQVVFNAAENDFVIPEVVYYSAPQEKDIAILRLPTPTEKRIPLQLRPSETVDIGEAAWALGYPGISSMYQQYSTFSPDDITLTQGIISKRNKPTGSSYEAFQMDVYINSGNSGGPLVDKNGFLLGINSAGIQSAEGTSEGVNYAIIANELIRILDNERLEYAVANTGLAWAPRWMGYVFLPLGALALAAGAFLLLGGKTRAFAPANAGGGQSHRPAKGQGPMGRRAVLRGVTGKYAGQSFDLTGGKVVIGRDPTSCNIVFEKNTPGISGRHCQVAYDPNGECFLITDLDSSYGTYLGNGKKLTANVTEKLFPGDTFYLCDNANRFVVAKE